MVRLLYFKYIILRPLFSIRDLFNLDQFLFKVWLGWLMMLTCDVTDPKQRESPCRGISNYAAMPNIVFSERSLVAGVAYSRYPANLNNIHYPQKRLKAAKRPVAAAKRLAQPFLGHLGETRLPPYFINLVIQARVLWGKL